MARKKIPLDVEETVLIQCRRRCCICFGLNFDLEIKQGQIAHLDQTNTNAGLDNLAFLCFDHHDQYDSRTSQSKGLTAREIKRFRKELQETIEEAWKEPLKIGTRTVVPPLDRGLSGHYIRDGKFESAELQVVELLSGNLRVTGLALWGKTREHGPNLGELDFEEEVKDNRLCFKDDQYAYELELSFDGDLIIATEERSAGYFGMNVSFEGRYYRAR